MESETTGDSEYEKKGAQLWFLWISRRKKEKEKCTASFVEK